MVSPSPTTTPSKVTSPDITGSWMVKGQPGTQYSLTFLPDGTYKMTSKGTQSDGKYVLSANTVTLTPTTGTPVVLTRTGDTLVGEVTWIRV